jgi:hypothetical protein
MQKQQYVESISLKMVFYIITGYFNKKQQHDWYIADRYRLHMSNSFRNSSRCFMLEHAMMPKAPACCIK